MGERLLQAPTAGSVGGSGGGRPSVPDTTWAPRLRSPGGADRYGGPDTPSWVLGAQEGEGPPQRLTLTAKTAPHPPPTPYYKYKELLSHIP